MKVAGKLQELRRSLPGCSVVLLGDCQSEVVLCVESDLRRPQERMDALCSAASQILKGDMGRITARLLGNGDDAPPSDAVLASDNATHVYLRSETDNDILCCICAPGVDVTRTRLAARAFLRELGDAA